MRRRDRMLAPEIERELDALDRALAGEDADAELAEVVQAMRANRPEPGEAFLRELDARAARGFGRAERRRLLPRRALLPSLAAATAAVLLVTLVATWPTGRESSGGGGARPSVVESGPSTLPAPSSIPPPTGGSAPGHRTRRVERSASLTLAAGAGKVDEVSDGVIRVTDQVGGTVLSSNVSSDQGSAGASFELSVPSERLRQTLAELSKLADVRSRNQATQDITGAFISPRERLTDALAERGVLLRQLARADTPNETASIRARLRGASSQIASARAELRTLRARTSYSRIAVTIQTGAGAGGGVGWGIDDALRDALRVLAVTVGVLLVALAALLPVAAVVTALGIGARSARRRRREAALDAV